MAELATTTVYGDLIVTRDLHLKGNIFGEGVATKEHTHDASDITSGILHVDRIPNLSAAKITSGTLAVARGGTGISSYTSGNYLRASGSTTLQQRTPAQVLSDIGAAPASHAHSAGDITSGTLGVARGGTGRSSLTAGYVLYGAGTSAVGISSSFFWNASNSRLGIGTTAPSYALHVAGDMGANMLTFPTGANTYGIRFWGNDNYKIYVSASGDSTHGGRLDGSSSDNMYFRVPTGSNRGFVFKSGSNVRAQIDASGNLYFTGTLQQGNIPAGRITSGTIAAARLPSASTSAPGIAQLNNTTTSSSTSQAATANAVRLVKQEARTDSSLEFRIEVRTSDPSSPALGRIWLRSDLT